MSGKSKIEWTEATWNPVTGCNKISPGCKNCYAERLAKRLKIMNNKRYRNGFTLTLHEDVIEQPLRWKTPRTIFVNSMSDLFHKNIPFEFIEKVFAVMKEAHWHTFQVLTKRSDRLKDLAPLLEWPRNVWMGVSVESQNYTFRINHLRSVPAAVRFLSCEPLLSQINDIDLEGIDWVIVGGESGPKARPMSPDWVTEIRDRCLESKVPFFFKQWGGVRKKLNGRILEDRTWDEMPCPETRVHSSCTPNRITNASIPVL